MSIPIDKLEDIDCNVYELTCATIRRAFQITMTGDEELEADEVKVVSTAIRQILDGKVEYQIEQ